MKSNIDDLEQQISKISGGDFEMDALDSPNRIKMFNDAVVKYEKAIDDYNEKVSENKKLLAKNFESEKIKQAKEANVNIDKINNIQKAFGGDQQQTDIYQNYDKDLDGVIEYGSKIN
jgi:Na+/phosphate symporter